MIFAFMALRLHMTDTSVPEVYKRTCSGLVEVIASGGSSE